jgi:2-hydroxy-3-keto-5-methylthiopentenyl-1-phosphate phosphatase
MTLSLRFEGSVMTESQRARAVLFLDFDGTITRCDVVDVILETYADPRWLVYEAAWRAGRMGSRDCLRAQMSLVHVTRQELDSLLDSIVVDEGLVELFEVCAARKILVHIISDGFDYCLNRILGRALNGHRSLISSVRASHLEVGPRPWRTQFPYFHECCKHGCATCKPEVMRLLNPMNAPAIFVGDGLSDRYAVESADLVFAKNELARYCRANSIAHTEYSDLVDVATHLQSLMNTKDNES